jgi:hypothetical protein
MAFRVDEKRRTLFSFGFKKWMPLISQLCDTYEQAERWIEQLKRCDRNYNLTTEYRIVEVHYYD